MKKIVSTIWKWICNYFDNPFFNIYLLIIGFYLLANLVIIPMISCNSKWLNSVGYFATILTGIGIYFALHKIISNKKSKNEG